MNKFIKLLLVVTIISCIKSAFLQDNVEEGKIVSIKTSNGMYKGIDVSAYQGTINWQAVASSGIKFAILRSTVYGGAMDSTFEYNYNNAIANGLTVMAYHFSYSLSVSQSQNDAQNLISKLNGKKLPIYLDLEWEQQTSLGPQGITNIAIAFVNTIKANGYECHIYSNTNWYRNYYYPAQLSNLGCKFWIAQYGYNTGEYDEAWKPNVGEYIWQYTSVGAVNGIAGNVDLDMLYGDLPGPGPTPPTPPTPVKGEKLVKIVVSVGVYRRNGPGGDVVGGYVYGSIVQVVGKTQDGEWYIDAEGTYFTANGNYVVDLVGHVMYEGVYIRSGPGTQYTALGMLYTIHTIQGLKKSGDWYYGNASTGITGWVYGPLVSW